MSLTTANFWQTLSLVSILFTAITTGQFLEAEILDVKLPFANSCPTPHYDGQDSIYLFGGCSIDTFSDILKFSLSSETLVKVGNLPGDAALGTTQSDNFGNIFYFGGGSGSREVYMFNPVTNITTSVATLPYSVYGHVSIKYPSSSSTVYILGVSYQGRDELLSFDMGSLTTSTLSSSLPFHVNMGTSVRVGSKAYVFDDDFPNGNGFPLELDLDTSDMQPVGPPVPIFSNNPSSVWDGTWAYLIGGYRPDTKSPSGGIIQFDPRTLQNNFLAVRNFPVEGTHFYQNAPAAVFVPSRNRIYFFGGMTDEDTGVGIMRDDIFYIDMPPNPDLFTCVGKPNGVYPHPTDCPLFMGCHDEELTVFRCPPPLLFDAVGLRCNFQSVVTCST